MKPYLEILEGESGLLHVAYPLPDGTPLPIADQLPIALNGLGAVAIELRDIIAKCGGNPKHVRALRAMLPMLESIHDHLMAVGAACDTLNPARAVRS